MERSSCLSCVVILMLTGCVRERVDLNRACANDSDCIDGYACQSGQCVSNCQVGAQETCDGIDNDCDGNVDEGFDCALGSKQACTEESGDRFCISGCTYSSCVENWYDGRYEQRLPITILGTSTTDMSTATLTDVPIPIKLDADILATAGVDSASFSTDGHDIAITDASSSPLPFQIESWDSTHGYVVWVKVPSLITNSATSLFLYYGNELGTDGSTTDVWDSGFVGVWHLAEAEGSTFADATANGNDASGGPAVAGAAAFGSGQSLSGEDGLQAPTVTLSAGSSFTLEGWFTPRDEAYHYHRVLSADVPIDDVEVRWPVGNDVGFSTRTKAYTKTLMLDANHAPVSFAFIEAPQGTTTLWWRNATAGTTTAHLLYGNDAASAPSNPGATFRFFASGSDSGGTWSNFVPGIELTDALTVNRGRFSAEIPVDLRDGFFVQSYFSATPPDSNPKYLYSGGLPFISSTPEPATDLDPESSAIFMSHAPTSDDGKTDQAFLRTSNGKHTNIDQTTYSVSEVYQDAGFGVYEDQVSIFTNDTLRVTASSEWKDPLNYLLLGAYDGDEDFYSTTYEMIFVRRWQGSTTTATASEERVNGLSIGAFAISAGAETVYASTSTSIATVTTSGDSQTHHVALVIDGMSYTLYVDGEARTSDTVDPHGDLHGLNLADVQSLIGELDEVRLSSTARSAAWLALEARSVRNDFKTVGSVQTLH